MLLKMNDAVGVAFYHSPQVGLHIIFFAHSPLGPFHGKLVIGRVGFHPVPVHFAALTQEGFVDDSNTDNIAEKVDHLLGPRQAA
jgi:hypothetical protein